MQDKKNNIAHKNDRYKKKKRAIKTNTELKSFNTKLIYVDNIDVHMMTIYKIINNSNYCIENTMPCDDNENYNSIIMTGKNAYILWNKGY